MPSGVAVKVAPRASKTAIIVPAGCRLSAGQSRISTCPPVTTANAMNGAALDRSGSMWRSDARIGLGGTRQVADVRSATSAVTVTPC